MRLDQRLVAQGLAASRARARALIAAGVVTVAGKIVSKPASTADGPIEVRGNPNPWVSRAALKLVHALDQFGLAPTGTALDLGASTGGFTEVLLARGAAHVHAVDVGHGQLHQSLVADPRVTDHSGVNARDLASLGISSVDWITADLSFIGLEKALPPALGLAKQGSCLVALIKPQFQSRPQDVGKGGLVRDPAVHRQACETVTAFLREKGWTILGVTDSPIEGSDGNREFLIAAQQDRTEKPGRHPHRTLL
ncbi:MAG: TlyA family RNA methyltransferase [Pseudomonadota bacterium]